MTRGRNTIEDVTELEDGTFRLTWSHGQRTIATAEQLKALELREGKFRSTPLDAA